MAFAALARSLTVAFPVFDDATVTVCSADESESAARPRQY